MAKKKYMKPLLLDGGFDPLTDSGDPIIIIGPSQGTQGVDPQYEWGDGITQEDIDWFYELYDDSYFAIIDTDEDYVISQDELNAWRNQP